MLDIIKSIPNTVKSKVKTTIQRAKHFHVISGYGKESVFHLFCLPCMLMT